MPESQDNFGFDRHRTFARKLGRTFLLMLIGVFFLIFTALAFYPKENAWWLILPKLAIEVCWTFWLSAVLFVWFDVPWLRLFYTHCERRFLTLVSIAKWVLPIIAVGAIGLVWYLHHIGVLPVRAR